MRAVIVRGAARVVVVFLVWSFVTFSLIHLTPGSPWNRGPEERPLPPEMVARLNERFGLNDPLPLQYVRWLVNFLQGDVASVSTMAQGDPGVIGFLLGLGIFYSGQLFLMAFPVALVLGVAAGALAASRPDSVLDRWIRASTVVALAVPPFLLALLIRFVLAPSGYWLPVDFLALSVPDRLWHMAPAVLALSLAPAAFIARHARAAVLEVVGEDYVRTAKSKGLTERRIFAIHILRNAAPSIAGLLGAMAALIAGSLVVVEPLFSLPGLGFTLYGSITERDYGLVMAIAAILAFAIQLTNLVTDVAYGLIDPRMRDLRDVPSA
jgi:ABC-type dipeptide/oligopeptide/nickel transport system permease component